MEEQQRLLVTHLERIVVDHVVRMAVGENQIDLSVVVVIEELQPPAAEQARGLRDSLTCATSRKVSSLLFW